MRILKKEYAKNTIEALKRHGSRVTAWLNENDLTTVRVTFSKHEALLFEDLTWDERQEIINTCDHLRYL